MKQFVCRFSGEHGQSVIETWTEDQIIDYFYTYWATNRLHNDSKADISRENCIKEWCGMHLAEEVPMQRENLNTIELKEKHYYFVLDEAGEFVEIYMPDNDPDAFVPENVVKVVSIITESRKSTLDLSHDNLIDKR